MRTPENVEQNALPTALTRPAVYFRMVFNPQFCSHVEIRDLRDLSTVLKWSKSGSSIGRARVGLPTRTIKIIHRNVNISLFSIL